MTETDRCGFVAVIGAPNAGKSTLVNVLVGQKVAIVSAKAQTTRTRLVGIAIEGRSQILLLDTPGIFEPRRRLDRAMVAAAWTGAQDSDLTMLVIDSHAGIGAEFDRIAGSLKGRGEKLFLVLNKIDLVRKPQLLALSAALTELLEPRQVFMVSATDGDGVADLKAALAEAMPAGPWHFPADQLSDATDRMVAAELTREQLYEQLHQELPYASAVETESWEERPGATVIHQQILIERDSQKAIVIGKGGSRLKAIGAAAREAIAEHLGRKVHLFLHVKVNPRWGEDRTFYREIGLDWAE